MPVYRFNKYFRLPKYEEDSFDFEVCYEPGLLAPYEGIYRCEGCGLEIARKESEPLPEINRCVYHRQRFDRDPLPTPDDLKEVRWRLVAAAKQQEGG